ncbi:MAG TPA: hypothetical protein VGV69_10780 [Solirubrobacterales bacterium]|nr:hypothetical protein [Solirubrobacterales bacterium]
MASPRSLEVLAALAAGEREAEFWEKHAEALTREERRRIAKGEAGVLARPLEPGWKVGDRLPVARNLTIEVTGVRWRRESYLTTFSVQDFRPLFVRRAVPVFDPPALDEHGEPIPPNEKAIADARLDGNYTRDAARGVAGAGEAVDLETQERISREGLRNYNLVHQAEVAKREIRSLTATLKRVRGEALKKGIDITPEVERIKAEVAALKSKVEKNPRHSSNSTL